MRYLVLFIVVFVAKNMCAQQAITDKSPEEALESYYELPRETIYLHLNKSTYVKGENLWFKAYVYNLKENTPFKETTNVYVGLYDKEGKQIDKRLFLAKDGYVQGNFEIDSTFAQGDLYIKAATNWMRNFKEDLAYVQKLRILNLEGQQEEATVLNADYDVQFLPEGGHMVTGVANTIGVKVLNNRGYGAAVENGVVLNNAGVQVAKFITNTLGHGKFRLTPEQGVKYKAVVDFPDRKELVFDLPLSNKKGISMELRSNTYQDKIPIYMETNQETLDGERDKKFYALVHKEDTSLRFDFEFSDNSLQTGFFISKKAIPKGVNTITVFNKSNQPLLERLFFNSYQIKTPKLEIKATKVDTDSISVSVNILGTSNENINLSASVLPEGTKAYNHSNNIYSSFYLEPYVKGYIENPSYYFEKRTAKKEFELDLLLLNQGWSSYQWNTVFKTPPEKRFEFERGIDLMVSVNEKIEEDKTFYIFPTVNHLEKEITLSKDDKSFNVNNFFLQREEEIFISEKNKKGELKSPKLYVIAKDRNTEDKVIPWQWNLNQEFDHLSDTQTDFILENNTIVLDEVVVRKKQHLEKVRNNVNVLPFLRRKIIPVDENTLFNFPFILDLIASRGYMVYKNPTNFDVVVRSRRGRLLNLYVDGQRWPDLQLLSAIRVEDIESYFFDTNNTIPGVANNFNEALYIHTKQSTSSLESQKKGFRSAALSYPIVKGFEPTKNFYTPRYSTYFSKYFEELGVIHWEPEILLKDSKASFKIIDTGLQHISIFIEGMDAAGNLFTLKKNLSLESF